MGIVIKRRRNSAKKQPLLTKPVKKPQPIMSKISPVATKVVNSRCLLTSISECWNLRKKLTN